MRLSTPKSDNPLTRCDVRILQYVQEKQKPRKILTGAYGSRIKLDITSTTYKGLSLRQGSTCLNGVAREGVFLLSQEPLLNTSGPHRRLPEYNGNWNR